MQKNTIFAAKTVTLINGMRTKVALKKNYY